MKHPNSSPGCNQILIGDALEQLTRLPEHYVDLVVTSPPYFRLRDYDDIGQLGMEAHIDEWVRQLRTVVRQLGRVLTPTGSLWLNLGDSYSTHPREGAGRKSLLLGPERLLLALQADGWIVRNKVIWAKTNPIPSPVRDRLATAWEPVYFLTRQASYFFDLDEIRTPHRSASPRRRPNRPLSAPRRVQVGRGPSAQPRTGLNRLRATGRVGHPFGKNPGDVWAIATGRHTTNGAHPAIYPIALVERIIRAACPQAVCTTCTAPFSPSGLPSCICGAPSRPGRVLDPFLGSGTTAVAALGYGRDWLGIELNPAYARAAAERIDTARRERLAPP